MTVAQLKQFLDRRFDAVERRFADVDRRFDAVELRFADVDHHFDSVNEKLDSIAASIKLKVDHHDHVLDEHDRRIKDLEGERRAPSDISR